jgi:hypothetical protein
LHVFGLLRGVLTVKAWKDPPKNAFLFFKKIHLLDFSAALTSRSPLWLYFASRSNHSHSETEAAGGIIISPFGRACRPRSSAVGINISSRASAPGLPGDASARTLLHALASMVA